MGNIILLVPIYLSYLITYIFSNGNILISFVVNLIVAFIFFIQLPSRETEWSGGKFLLIVFLAIGLPVSIHHGGRVINGFFLEREKKHDEEETLRIEKEVSNFATSIVPQIWEEYVREKKHVEEISDGLKGLEENKIPVHFQDILQKSKGVSEANRIMQIREELLEQKKKMKSKRDGLLKEIQEKHQAFLRAEAETKKRQEVERAAAERKQKDSAVREQRREEALKEFALKEAPQMWQTYEGLGAAIENQSSRMAELRKTLVSFERNPDEDADYMELVSNRQAMVESRDSLHEKIQKAYLQYCKFLATPGNAEVESLHRKVMEDAMQEADAAKMRFKEMMSEK